MQVIRYNPYSPVRAARLTLGLSQERLAVAAGLSLSTVYFTERAPHLITTRTAQMLAKVLGVKPDELMVRVPWGAP